MYLGHEECLNQWNVTINGMSPLLNRELGENKIGFQTDLKQYTKLAGVTKQLRREIIQSCEPFYRIWGPLKSESCKKFKFDSMFAKAQKKQVKDLGYVQTKSIVVQWASVH